MSTATLENFLTKLESVRSRGSRWAARCPAHADKSPSLSISEGVSGLLLKCWAGCSVQEICEALGLKQKDLFFNALDANPQRRRAAAQERDCRQREREQYAVQQGILIDAMREAGAFVQSRHGLDISGWRGEQLDAELHAVADAYFLLEREALHG